jgi:uroporphyrinogen-III synthase
MDWAGRAKCGQPWSRVVQLAERDLPHSRDACGGSGFGRLRPMALIGSRQRWRALVTRPREEAGGLVQALAQRDIAALVEPMLQIHFREVAPDLADVQAVLCTSANGVSALARSCSERAVPLFAVGDATAARARALGFTTVESAGGNAADLVRLVALRLQLRKGRLLHVSGSEVAGDLVGGLRERGFAVERSILYEARPVATLSDAAIQALDTGEVDFVLFFSPRTAAIFTRLVEAAGIARACEKMTALSISTATDAALGGSVWREHRVAEQPNQPALLDLLDRLIAERGCGG